MKNTPEPSYTYSPVEAEAHTPPYKIHKYFARRPHNVFSQLVREFTREGEVVLDPFCGGGVTIYESVTQNRRAVGCDLNPLSIFIVKNMIKRTDPADVFIPFINELKAYLHHLHGDFMTFSLNGETYPVHWAELALCVRCPECGRQTPLANEYKVRANKYHCSNRYCVNCSEGVFNPAGCERSGSQYLSYVFSSKKLRIEKGFADEDMVRYRNHIDFLKEEMRRNGVEVPRDLIPMDWDRQHEDGLARKGILYFQDFFTKRNLYILLLLKSRIEQNRERLGDDVYELVRLVFSNVLKDTNVMAFTSAGWQGGRPVTWSKHAYWIPNQYCEVAIMPAFEKAVERIVSAMEFNRKKEYGADMARGFDELGCRNVLLFNRPVNLCEVPEDCVDAVITDPPYGSNVQYLELSHFWYPWNRELYGGCPDFRLEAVSNRKRGFRGAKSQYDYERNLLPVFEKSYKVLKEGRFMVLTFNNKDISSWLALLFSIFRAGFSFHEMYFQDGVKNYRQTSHTRAKGSPYGDFIYVFVKDSSRRSLKRYTSESEFAEELDRSLKKHLEDVEDRNVTILEMFRGAVPLIEGFAKTYLEEFGCHNLYERFNKKYLEKLYPSGNED